MGYEQEQREVEAAYWQEWEHGNRVARDWINTGVSRKLIRESATLGMEIQSHDPYWQGMAYAARRGILGAVLDALKLPMKARSQ